MEMNIIYLVIILLLILFIFFINRGTYNVYSYKEAFYKIMNYIDKGEFKRVKKLLYIVAYQKWPVKESDLDYLFFIASIALRPIFKNNYVAKKICEKILYIKRNDFFSNYILHLINLEEGRNIEAHLYAVNLLHADYKSYMEKIGAVKQIKLFEEFDEKIHIAEIYFKVSSYFKTKGDLYNSEFAYKLGSSILKNTEKKEKKS